MENYGMKIAKQGKSAFTTEKLDILFNSQKSALKIIMQGYNVLAVPDSGVRVYSTIEHRLGFTPAFIAFAQLSNTTKSYPISGIGDGGEDVIAEINNDALRIGVVPNGFVPFTAYFQWYLMANKIDA